MNKPVMKYDTVLVSATLLHIIWSKIACDLKKSNNFNF